MLLQQAPPHTIVACKTPPLAPPPHAPAAYAPLVAHAPRGNATTYVAHAHAQCAPRAAAVFAIAGAALSTTGGSAGAGAGAGTVPRRPRRPHATPHQDPTPHQGRAGPIPLMARPPMTDSATQTPPVTFADRGDGIHYAIPIYVPGFSAGMQTGRPRATPNTVHRSSSHSLLSAPAGMDPDPEAMLYLSHAMYHADQPHTVPHAHQHHHAQLQGTRDIQQEQQQPAPLAIKPSPMDWRSHSSSFAV